MTHNTLIITFEHIETKQQFVGSATELAKYIGKPKCVSNISRLIRGDRHHVNGWRIVSSRKKPDYYQRDNKDAITVVRNHNTRLGKLSRISDNDQHFVFQSPDRMPLYGYGQAYDAALFVENMNKGRTLNERMQFNRMSGDGVVGFCIKTANSSHFENQNG
jgi:hypothetical protein